MITIEQRFRISPHMRTFFDPFGIRPENPMSPGEPFSQSAIKLTLRTAVAGLGIFGAYKTREFKMLVMMGAVTFTPSLLMGGGAWMAYTGTAKMVASLAAPSLKGLAIGLAKVGGGYLSIVYHDLPEEYLGVGGFYDLIIIDALSQILK